VNESETKSINLKERSSWLVGFTSSHGPDLHSLREEYAIAIAIAIIITFSALLINKNDSYRYIYKCKVCRITRENRIKYPYKSK